MDNQKFNQAEVFETLPVVPLRDVVVFPHMIIPFIVGRRHSIEALEHALMTDKRIFLATQHNARVDNPSPEEIYSIGVVVNIIQNMRLPGGNIKVLVEGVSRGRIVEWHEKGSHHEVIIKTIQKDCPMSKDKESAVQKLMRLFEQYVKLNHNLPYESILSTLSVEELSKLTDTISAHVGVSIEEKQGLLETLNPLERVVKLTEVLERENEKLQVDRKIQSRVRKQMEKAQKEYYLNEKMRAIQNELGRKDEQANEVDELASKIKNARMPKEAEEKAMLELKRLQAMPPVSAEATVSRNYLEWLISVPWHKKSKECRDIVRAEEILNEDHYGLEKVKERIIEFLAVRQLVKNIKGSILCFVGPPGVGKTSLARSIARATGRHFVRLSLGGVRDEAEIRGHRRTYIGAFPGQIIQLMKKAGTKNPVFLIDEIDKMSSDFRGDPSSALLEVLDPEQNHMFVDHYLDVEFDLSKVFFILTANVIHTVPAALKDRMEVIRIAGYTMNEKVAIAEQFLLKKQLSEHGLKPENLALPAETIRCIIEQYTREAGVRNLEREIASIARKTARRVVKEGRNVRVVLEPQDLQQYLGVPRYRTQKGGEVSEVGVASGLAWTEVGGEILHIEVSLLKGRGKLTLTGKLGDVMQESAQAAFSYTRKKVGDIELLKDFYRKFDIHIHIPEGAIPKDGPSAGITMAVALVSAVTGIPVRKDVAMTGEITLRGKILPIGGVKEKVLAAFRAGIKEVILPNENEKDLEDIPKDVTEVMTVRLVREMDEVLKIALVDSGEFSRLPARGEKSEEQDKNVPTSIQTQ
jgi:ATP-dependent Lon protease